MMEVAPNGKVVSEYRDPLAHHDQNHLDDGTLLYTALEPMTEDEAKTVEGGIPNSEAYDGKIYADTIKHVNPKTGELLWKWRIADHLDRKQFPLQLIYAREHYTLINAVSFLRDGNVLASLRSVSAVIIISKETGEVIWHLDSTVVAQQHCATELENGNILIFDNGALRHHTSAVNSRVIEVNRETKQIVWEYTDRTFPMAFFTPFMGSAQRLRNGNTFITEAAFGRMFEVTPEGKTVWEYVNPHLASYEGLDAKELEDIGFDYASNALFRAYKYTPEEVPWLTLPSPAATP
jgi:outer membrane protein assembly factor BamB